MGSNRRVLDVGVVAAVVEASMEASAEVTAADSVAASGASTAGSTVVGSAAMRIEALVPSAAVVRVVNLGAAAVMDGVVMTVADISNVVGTRAGAEDSRLRLRPRRLHERRVRRRSPASWPMGHVH